MRIDDILADETLRNRLFPCTTAGIYLAHGGVAPITGPAVEAMAEFARRGSLGNQENDYTLAMIARARRLSAELIGAHEDEISLLGPTALALNMVSLGLDWEPGDEVVYYSEDYPSNVYPWSGLRRKGVEPRPIRTLYPGVITWDKIEPLLSDRTRLVSLATCNFLSGYRPDIPEIGRRLREREILFSVDGIQTLGAFPFSVEYVDFLSADSHKWMLGPSTAGLFYVSNRMRERLFPALLGSWNVVSPQFVAQEDIAFEEGGRRYEPGSLNLPGICGMAASLEILLDVGIEAIAARLLKLRKLLLEGLEAKGYVSYMDDWEHGEHASDRHRSGIVTVFHRRHNMEDAARALAEEGITVSLRRNRADLALLRFSPHFYTREEELERAIAVLP